MNESGGCCRGGSGITNDKNIKAYVKEKYGQVAENADSGKNASCGCSCTSKDAITRDLYAEAEIQGLPVAALLASMGCANPIALADLNPGEVVLDLGSGGGIDVLLSAKRVGPTGKAYGLDMTEAMLALAEKNKAKMSSSSRARSKMCLCLMRASMSSSAIVSSTYRLTKTGFCEKRSGS